GRQLLPSSKDPLRFLDGGYEPVDLILLGVYVERRSRRGRYALAGHQRHRAVMAGAKTDLVAVGDRRQVVRMDSLEREGDDTSSARRGWAVERQAIDVAQRFVGVLGDLQLVRAHGVHAEAAQVIDRRAKSDHLGDRLGAGLALPRPAAARRSLDAD